MNLDSKRERKQPSRLDRNRFFASKNRHRPGPRLVPRFLFRFLFRRRLFRATPLALVRVAVVCIFRFVDPIRILADSHFDWLSEGTYQLLPTILMPFASAIL